MKRLIVALSLGLAATMAIAGPRVSQPLPAPLAAADGQTSFEKLANAFDGAHDELPSQMELMRWLSGRSFGVSGSYLYTGPQPMLLVGTAQAQGADWREFVYRGQNQSSFDSIGDDIVLRVKAAGFDAWEKDSSPVLQGESLVWRDQENRFTLRKNGPYLLLKISSRAVASAAPVYAYFDQDVTPKPATP